MASSPRPQESQLEAGSRLSGCKILGEIGSGGMARVYLALDERLNRRVAIKTLNDRYSTDAGVRARFMQEALALARLDHPHIVRIYSLGETGEQPHFVMEYLEGKPLTETAKALPLQQKIELFLKIVRGVEFLHDNNIVHRDLKPGNILVGFRLEPKLLDFGLARQLDGETGRITTEGMVLGTPAYLSPEQTRSGSDTDGRSDIFALGTILFELLTGELPFRGETIGQLAAAICNQDPVLPRRLNPNVPGQLQNICLKALEKDPVQRYLSAREMGDDLERYLAGEPVLAAPTSYSRILAQKVEQHVSELNAWKNDHVLSEPEYDALRKNYDRLFEREDAWIMEVRRLSVSQVALYLGAWVIVVGAVLLLLFQYVHLSNVAALLVVYTATLPTSIIGLHFWRRRNGRVALAYLLAASLLLPIAFALTFVTIHFFRGFTRGRADLEFFGDIAEQFRFVTNAQMWWALLLALPFYDALRRFTKASLFSFVAAVVTALLGMVTLLRFGFLQWLREDEAQAYASLLPLALLFFAIALLFERRGLFAHSRYYYPIAVGFTVVGLTGCAATGDFYKNAVTALAPWTNGSREYLFIANAGWYYLLSRICDRFHTPQTRLVATTFRFLVPGHVLTSLLLLGLDASSRWEAHISYAHLRYEARLFEVVLPLIACMFVFGSIAKQMKNYLASGLAFFAVGVVRLEQDLFRDRALWPITLVVGGVALMYCAVNYSKLAVAVNHSLRNLRSRLQPGSQT